MYSQEVVEDLIIRLMDALDVYEVRVDQMLTRQYELQAWHDPCDDVVVYRRREIFPVLDGEVVGVSEINA